MSAVAEACASYPHGMHDVDLAAVGALIGDPSRARMLDGLMGGRALAAGELARIAGVGRSTASEHLARLLDGGLVEVVAQGRHRYYRIAGPEVGAALEALSHVAPAAAGGRPAAVRPCPGPAASPAPATTTSPVGAGSRCTTCSSSASGSPGRTT